MTVTGMIAIRFGPRALLHAAVVLGLLLTSGCGRSTQQLEADRLKNLGCDVRFRMVGKSLEVFWVEVPQRQQPIDFAKSLEQFTSLETLILTNTQLQDEDITKLPELTRLKLLDVSQNNLSDRSVARLSRMNALETLVLDGNPITDNSISDLGQLRHLRAICIRKTGVTEAGLMKLRDALPQCLIETSE